MFARRAQKNNSAAPNFYWLNTAVLLALCLLQVLLLAGPVTPARGQGRLRELIRQRLSTRRERNGSDDSSKSDNNKNNSSKSNSNKNNSSKSNSNKNNSNKNNSNKLQIAGLSVAVWEPTTSEKPAPLVIFSHGFKGINTQTPFLMKALADAGYVVMAPNHHDAITNGSPFSRPELSFKDFDQWNENTYRDRGNDIKNLIAALHKDPQWSRRIDWSRLALAGHSLGGYTVLACGGAWPTWKIPGVKAILALSPYAQPFLSHGDLAHLGVPVMYQGGTLDFGITPFVKRDGGAFSLTSSPAYFVDFKKAGHFFWTAFTRDESKQNLINHYSLVFLNRYVRDDRSANPDEKLDGVADLQKK